MIGLRIVEPASGFTEQFHVHRVCICFRRFEKPVIFEVWLEITRIRYPITSCRGQLTFSYSNPLLIFRIEKNACPTQGRGGRAEE